MLPYSLPIIHRTNLGSADLHMRATVARDQPRLEPRLDAHFVERMEKLAAADLRKGRNAHASARPSAIAATRPQNSHSRWSDTWLPRSVRKGSRRPSPGSLQRRWALPHTCFGGSVSHFRCRPFATLCTERGVSRVRGLDGGALYVRDWARALTAGRDLFSDHGRAFDLDKSWPVFIKRLAHGPSREQGVKCILRMWLVSLSPSATWQDAIRAFNARVSQTSRNYPRHYHSYPHAAAHATTSINHA
mmetsp:Transcript_23213/g.59679  ORF Transcript_23213/g.59679 Transcript_23213/m.59679 type:complete len:246 (+) Transcript_23213:444-1181(+)